MDQSVKITVLITILLAGALYAYSIIQAGINSIQKDKANRKKLHPFLVTAVAVIGDVLATNFGAVIGITVKTPVTIQNDSAKNIAPKFLGLRSTFRPDGMS